MPDQALQIKNVRQSESAPCTITCADGSVRTLDPTAAPAALPYELAARAYAAAAVTRKTAADSLQYAHDEVANHEITTGEPLAIPHERRDALTRAIRHYNTCTDREIEAEETLRRAALEFCGEDPAIADDPL